MRRTWESEGDLLRLATIDGIDSGLVRSDVGAKMGERDIVAVAVGLIDGSSDDRSGADFVADCYRRGGIGALGELRGEFTYAVWDRRDRSLFVGCDAVALKAPAFSWDGQTFLFCSRALPLLRFSGVRRAWDDVYLAHAVSGLWCRDAAATAFLGVHRMVTGQLIRVHRGHLEQLAAPGPLALERRRLGAGDVGAARELGACMNRVLERRLGESGRVCVALSGGIDSAVVASAPAWGGVVVHAFSIERSEQSSKFDDPFRILDAAIPFLHRRRIEPMYDAALLESLPLTDDPLANAPALQPARVALLRAARESGFEVVLDGEGGDEVFDLAWQLEDLLREPSLRSLTALATTAGAPGRLLKGLSGRRRPPVRVRALRPWLRPSFWKGDAFRTAWEEAASFARLGSARERFPRILGAHGRYRRGQELICASLHLRGSSPFLDRDIIEYVGSLPAHVVVDPRCSKGLLRRTAAQWLPAGVAWREKREPLHDWLVLHSVCDDANLSLALANWERCAWLQGVIDPDAIVRAVTLVRHYGDACRALARSVAALFAIIQWMATVSARYGM